MHQGTHHDNELLAAALAYAGRGWRVHPLRPGSKRPLLRRWQRVASCDPETIRGWWARWPAANVGIATGGGLLVIDEDGPDGRKAVVALDLPPTLTVRTPRADGGRQYYLTCPPDLEAELRNRTGVLPGLDLRTTGGYVVAPPSRLDPYDQNPEGGVYAWTDDRPCAELPAAAADLLRARLTERRRTPTPRRGRDHEQDGSEIAREVDRGGLPAIIPEGARNETLHRHGSSLRGRGADGPTILEELLAANTARCRPPLGRAEVEKIVRSVAGYAPGPVRLDNRLLNAEISVQAKTLAALIALNCGKVTQEDLADLAGEPLRNVQRWWAELREAGLLEIAAIRPRRRFTLVPVEVLRDTELSAGAKALYMTIAQLGNGGRVQVGQEVLAERLGAADRTVRKWRAELERAGLVAVSRALYAGDRGRRMEVNRYRLLGAVGVDTESQAALGKSGVCPPPRAGRDTGQEDKNPPPRAGSTRTTGGEAVTPLPSPSAVPASYMSGAVAVTPCPEGGRGGTPTATPDQGDPPEVAGVSSSATAPATLAEIARRAGVTVRELERWRDRGMTLEAIWRMVRPADDELKPR